ncbi:MAG TPA: cupin domain-containing protein [Armatimonadota bacterium]|jgi:quercetin dioxygenase-like cupin family protein
MDYTYLKSLADGVEIPKNGIISTTVSGDDHFKVMLFGFDTGQELSEHTASVPAILQIVKGDADLTLGEDKRPGPAGTWAHMPANLPHSVFAKTPVVMLLIMAKK